MEKTRSEKEQEIKQVQIQILSEIAQCMHYFEHSRHLIIDIIRSTIFNVEFPNQQQVVNILTNDDNAYKLKEKLLSLYKIYYREDLRGWHILNSLLKSFTNLYQIRNILVHSLSELKNFEDAETLNVDEWRCIEIRSAKFDKDGVSLPTRKVFLEELSMINVVVVQLYWCFGKFLLTIKQPIGEKDATYEQYLTEKKIKDIDSVFTNWLNSK